MQENGVKLLHIRALNPIKYCLALMDALFTDDEMATHCFSSGSSSTKNPLPQEKVDLIKGKENQ